MFRMRGRILYTSGTGELLFCENSAFFFWLRSLWCTDLADQEPYHQTTPKPDPYHVVHIIRKGSCTFTFPDRDILTVSEGHFIVFPPSVSEMILTESRCFSKITFRFRLVPKSSEASSFYAAALEALNTVKPRPFSQKISALTEQIRELYEEPGYDLKTTLLFLVQSVVMNILNTVGAGGDKKEQIQDSRVKRAVEHIKKTVTADTGISQITELTQVSARQLNRLFKRELGMTAGEYIIKARQHRLRELLMDPEMSLADIVCIMNYSDIASLNRDFKRAEGVTPRQFRKAMKVEK